MTSACESMSPCFTRCARDAVDDEARRDVGRGEQADDAVGIADRRDLGGRDDDRLVGAGDRVLEALLDAGRAVDQHEVVLRLQLEHERCACPRA